MLSFSHLPLLYFSRLCQEETYENDRVRQAATTTQLLSDLNIKNKTFLWFERVQMHLCNFGSIRIVQQSMIVLFLDIL